jgi:hypothetical protein
METNTISSEDDAVVNRSKGGPATVLSEQEADATSPDAKQYNDVKDDEYDHDKYMRLIQFQSIRNQMELETAIRVQWNDQNDQNDQQEHHYGMSRPLQLSTILQPEDMAPLFHGTQWAGTRVWHAAIAATQYLLQHYSSLLNHGNNNINASAIATFSSSDVSETTPSSIMIPPPCSRRTVLLELGCGLGVPGMILHALFPDTTSVILTDQASIMSQLETNLQRNFGDANGGDDEPLISSSATTTNTPEFIQARALDWSFIVKDDDHGDDNALNHSIEDNRTLSSTTNVANNTFWKKQFDWKHVDIVLNCDCIFEPLYGTSYTALAHVLSWALQQNPQALVLTSVERRNQDGVDTFLELLRQSPHVSAVDRVWHDEEYHIEIYQAMGCMKDSSITLPTNV